MNLNEYLNNQGRGAAAALAESVGCGRSHMSLIASGKRLPSPQLARAIEVKTGGVVSAAQLLGIERLGASGSAAA